MKGFRNTTKMQMGHNFAAGGHVPRPHFAQAHPVRPKPANSDTVNGLTARTPDMDGNSLQKRSVPSTEVDSEHGGKSAVSSGYASGGKVVHVHQHYHNGKRLPSKRKMEAARRKAEGGLISSGTAGVKLGQNASSNATGTPSIRSNFKKGGKIGPVKKGALHAQMGIPQGEKIGKKRLEAAKHSSSPQERKRANFALNMNKATGGTINPVATGGTINRFATGGTQNPMQCGGALYAAGGGVKAALRAHVDSPAPQGHKGLGAMIRRGG